MSKKNAVYETPLIEVVEFSVEENITTSANFGPSTLCTLTDGS